MCLTENRPFLSKTWGDLTRAVGEIDCQVKYVLNNARLLVLGFFEEKELSWIPLANGSEAIRALNGRRQANDQANAIRRRDLDRS